METCTHEARWRRMLVSAAIAATALSGCAVYDPYPVYAAAPAPAPYTPYYYYPYAYGSPAWVGPPFSLNFGYYEHRYRGGGHDWHGGRGWSGNHGFHDGRGWHGHGWNGGRGWSGHGGGWGGHGGFHGRH